MAPLLAAIIGIVTAVLVGSSRNPNPTWPRLNDLFGSREGAAAIAKDPSQLERMRPQKQAEALLQLAIGHSDSAVRQISSRADRWRGKIEWNSQIANLTTAALNSNDMRVRQSGIEVELAAYGLAKNSASLDYLLKTAESTNHSQKVWALWALGLMANRGVQMDRVVVFLTAHLKDSDVDSRRWAVEGLALTGSDSAIPALLTAMHDDPSPIVRERAACGIASTGMFTPKQRWTAVPQLLNYTEDESLDAQTHARAFQALADITHQHLPNDAAVWRQWYASKGA